MENGMDILQNNCWQLLSNDDNTYMTNATHNKADNMNRYYVSFDLVCTFTGELKTCFAGEIDADTAEIAVIFAHDKVRKEQRIFGKPVNVKTAALITA